MPKQSKKPNIVIIFLDDSGWADFRPFGKTAYPTPNVEKLAENGTCFSQFYVPQAICSASRACLLTGSYPGRTKIFGALPPESRGLDPQFPTFAEIFKKEGYATGIFGKWHVGDHEETRPWNRGFDESSGLMYSNDMWKHHPECRHFDKFPLHFWKNGSVEIEDLSPEQQCMLTTWYTEHAVDFISRHKEEPFFLYVPHSMPHVPIFCSDKFKGKSGEGLYADVMMEIDWSVGEIMNSLDKAGIAEDTIVMFSSDNGPWLSYGNHAGKTPYREGKATMFDGGTRSACIMCCPGKIKKGETVAKAFSSVDILPTFAGLAGIESLPGSVDGKDVWEIINGNPDAANPHEYYPFSTGRNFEGVISSDGKWKLHLPHPYRTLLEVGKDGKPGRYGEAFIELSLFDMENDPLETVNLVDEHPEIVADLKHIAEQHKQTWYENRNEMV